MIFWHEGREKYLLRPAQTTPINTLHYFDMRQLACFFLILAPVFAAEAQTTGTITDARDGKVYKTVKIGSDEWMSENLNYQVRGSYCYEDKTENCEKYGRIYTWPMLMMYSAKEAGRGICPEGWHVPTDAEWTKLDRMAKRAKDLSAGGRTGFNLQFAGSRFTEGNYGFLEQCATYWTSTEDEENSKFAWTRYIYQDKLYKNTERYSTNKMYGQSVRCIKDK